MYGERFFFCHFIWLSETMANVQFCIFKTEQFASSLTVAIVVKTKNCLSFIIPNTNRIFRFLVPIESEMLIYETPPAKFSAKIAAHRTFDFIPRVLTDE